MSRPIPDVLRMIADLVAAPSVSSVNADFDQSNQAVVDRLAQWVEDLGWRVQVLPVPDHPGKSNLVATLGTGEGGLVLSGHTDTVPFDAEGWSQDPFALTERDGRLYGLGTCDMKAFFALALEAAAGLKATDLAEPVILVATADEESSMAGAKALVQAGQPRARHGVIGEPTGLTPVRMHKGMMMEAIRLHGRSGHSSDPALGVNALEGMHRVIAEVLAWRAELQERHRNPAFRVPVPTLNLGHIHGGDNPNRICGDCELQIDLRPLPGMALDELREQLRERLSRLLADSPLRLEVEPLFPGLPAMETPAGAAIVQAAEALTGRAAEAAAFGTEGPFLQELGMDTLILGPGDIDQAHQPDEYLAMDRIAPMVDLIRQLIGRLCMKQ
ncbi:MAG TPA: acetylornithine deacetylase [Gammaproteobacteria bacterium]|nr:acetylornithine deacetylase [Gammaproteobacteria bacterium]